MTVSTTYGMQSKGSIGGKAVKVIRKFVQASMIYTLPTSIGKYLVCIKM